MLFAWDALWIRSLKTQGPPGQRLCFFYLYHLTSDLRYAQQTSGYLGCRSRLTRLLNEFTIRLGQMRTSGMSELIFMFLAACILQMVFETNRYACMCAEIVTQ